MAQARESQKGSKDWKPFMKEINALWTHSGRPDDPHALLGHRMCSTGIFRDRQITACPGNVAPAAKELAKRVCLADLMKCDRVVGPSDGSAILAHELARELGVWSGHIESSISLMLSGASPAKNFPDDGQKVLLAFAVLEPITARLLVPGIVKAIEDSGGVVLPKVLTLFNATGEQNICGRDILSLADQKFDIRLRSGCPLCKNGSPAVDPEANWFTLNVR